MTSIRDPQSAVRNLLLIGYRGTGKTTVGRLLAARLGFAFVDADDEIEARAGKSIAEIFTAGGEAAFRDLEQEVVAELSQRQQHVISLGGGAILRAENRKAIRRAGYVVWLTASAETILARVVSDETTSARRPNLTASGGLAEVETLLAEREPFYAECAQLQIATEGLDAAEVVEMILVELRPTE